jgi:hypothetical protein
MLVVVALTGLVAIGAAVGLSITSRDRGNASGARAASTTGALQLTSDPPGAHVLLDGEPTGLVTPATIGGLRAGRTVELRLDKPGYAQIDEKVTVQAGAPVARTFRLVATAGNVRFDGVPARAVVYLDDAQIDASTPLLVPLGEHKLRVEVDGVILTARAVTVTPGEQEISIRRKPGGP